MDIQTILDNAVKARRADSMKESEQLTIGEFILKLEVVKNKDLPVLFDDNEYKPTSFESWRGSYCELSLNYKGEGSYNSNVIEYESEYGNGYKQVDSNLSDAPTCQELLDLSNRIKGETFVGYKGGNFTMGKTTPIWVSSYGCSSGFKVGKEDSDEEFYSQAVIDVVEIEERVSIITKLMSF